jgi:hypothetical protein
LQSQFHYDAILSALSVATIQSDDNYIATKVMPVVPVDKQSAKYYVFDPEWFLRDDMQLRPPATESAGTGFKLSRDSYDADVWALHHDISDQDRANADEAIDLERIATRMLAAQAKQRLERSFFANFLTTGKWGLDLTGVSGTPSTNQFKQWNDPASDPAADIDTAADTIAAATGLTPNTLVLGQTAFRRMQRNPAMQDRFKYTSAASITKEMIGSIFDIAPDRIFIAKAIKATNKEGQSLATGFIAGKVAWLGYVAPGPGMETPSAGYTFNWRQPVGGGDLSTAPVYKFRMDELKADRVETEIAFDQKVVAPALGVFFNSAVA